ncbi:MAG: PAS domain-containing protein [Alphaproteobacteria bacterium]|nr:PAS domain-containing protein [Alphaproteobacteria bacterium]MBU0798344.1 PAS domain-containing protein [Alphaproteobacteria bacterium]MBU0887445.1 PAS domain-containing protein [Alphaproteobacteria bacterium]MBU1813346.1 PAS domain-containing protein [Alphaproteobacteria bacterium]MBU2091195.1 PAS domain-containing protein [Alphaproteobacteria bacterium]
MESQTLARNAGEEDIIEPELRTLLRHWHDLKAEMPLPRREQLDPVLLPFPLDRVYLIEVKRNPTDFMIRLAGEKVQGFYGSRVAGKSVRELTPATLSSAVFTQMLRVSALGTPFYSKSGFETPGAVFRYSRLLLPFGAEQQVTHLLGAVVQYFRPNAVGAVNRDKLQPLRREPALMLA